MLTWRQSGMYADIETLYQTTIERNPDCSMAHNNLAAILERRRDFGHAIEHYQRAVEINSDNAEAHNSLGTLLERCGQSDEAIEHYRRALDIKPRSALFHYNLAMALRRCSDRPTRRSTISSRRWLPGPTWSWPITTWAPFWRAADGSTRRSATTSEALKLRPELAEAHYQLGAI